MSGSRKDIVMTGLVILAGVIAFGAWVYVKTAEKLSATGEKTEDEPR